MAIASINFEQAVRKAQARAAQLGPSLSELRVRAENTPPGDLNSAAAQRDRQQFLEARYGDDAQAERALERIVGGNELQPANFLLRGAMIARAVLRIVLNSASGQLLGYGSGFLVGDGVLLTNHHVLQDAGVARLAQAQAFYELALDGRPVEPQSYALDPDSLFYTSEALDFSLCAVAPRDDTGAAQIADIGWLPLIGSTGKAMDGEWLTIVQHPKGERKQLCVRENQLIKRDNDVLWYSTDTLGGSSGSPVCSNDWLVVALHHSGVPETRNGKWQTVDGRDFDPAHDDEDQIKWVANEGIRISRIVDTLTGDPAIAGHPRVRGLLASAGDADGGRLPLIFRSGATPPDLMAAARHLATASASPAPASPPSAPMPRQETDMPQRLVTVTLAIADDGSVSIANAAPASESTLVAERSKPKSPPIDAPVVPEEDWIDGYDPDFLNGPAPVNLPIIDEARRALIAPLRTDAPVYGQPVPDDETAAAGVLKYNGYSVVMNKARRVAFFSAANINGGVEFPNLTRGTDVWLYDDRIDRAHQIDNRFYTRNRIDRGHLTRREDMEWGTDPVDATRRANGTCTWTNCSPQQELFNQDKSPDPAVHLWGGLEKYILEQTARHYQFRVQVFTGPVFDDADPVYREVQIPLDFWKVVVAVDADGKLFATSYVLSQRDVLDVNNLDEAAIAQPFGAFQTYQRPIAEVEAATGLSFTYGGGHSLRDVDPLAKELAKPAWQRRRRHTTAEGTSEAFALSRPDGSPLGGGSGALTSHADIVLPF